MSSSPLAGATGIKIETFTSRCDDLKMDPGDRFPDGGESISFNRKLAIWSPGFLGANDALIRVDYWREHFYWFEPERTRRERARGYLEHLRSSGEPSPIPAGSGRAEWFYNGWGVHDRPVRRRIRILAIRHPIIGELTSIDYTTGMWEFNTVAGEVFMVDDEESAGRCVEARHIKDWTLAVTFISSDPGTITLWSPHVPPPVFALSPRERGVGHETGSAPSAD